MTAALDFEAVPESGPLPEMADGGEPNGSTLEPNMWTPRIRSVDDTWFGTKPPARKWLFTDTRTGKGVFPVANVGMLVAAGGIGKTMMLCQLAIAVATGSPWLGFSIGEPGRVFLALGEENQEETERRIYYASQAMGVRPPRETIDTLPLRGVPCELVQRGDQGNPVSSPFAHWLRHYVRERGPFRLVIVDPLSRFGGPDVEKDNHAATRYVQELEALTATGSGVIHAHHSAARARGRANRAVAVSNEASRGVTAITDGGRFTMTLAPEQLKHKDPEVQRRLGELVQVLVTKSNYGKKPEPFFLRRDEDNEGMLMGLDHIDQDLVAQSREGTDAQAERRCGLEAEREAKIRRRNATDDEAARGLMAASPNATMRVLLATLKATLACGTQRADDAIKRVRGASPFGARGAGVPACS